MADKKLDGRVKYTRMVIRDSLFSLLREKPIGKVTVTDICRGADINRATFYAHYSDPFELLQSIEREMIDDVTERLSDAFTDEESDLFNTLAQVFGYIRDNAEACSILLSDSGDNSFQAQVVSMLAQRFISEWAAKRTISRQDAEYLYIFAAIGSVGVIRKWLRDGMTKSDEDMAELIIKISNNGYRAF